MDEWILSRPVSLWGQMTNDAGESCPLLFRSFVSSVRCVVLARSNSPQTEVHLDVCESEGIPVLRRRGGGGTVVLGPGCLILTLGFFARPLFQNDLIFSSINAAWIEALEAVQPDLAPLKMRQRGISDLAVGDRKIAGTSLFRRKHLAVFQGSLLVHPDWSWIDRCLKHPSREPDYRQGRAHREFLTSLSEMGYEGDVSDLADALDGALRVALSKHLSHLAIPAPVGIFEMSEEI